MLKSLKILSLCLHRVSRVYSLWEWWKFQQQWREVRELSFFYWGLKGQIRAAWNHILKPFCNKSLNFLRKWKSSRTQFFAGETGRFRWKRGWWVFKQVWSFLFVFCTHREVYYYYHMVFFFFFFSYKYLLRFHQIVFFFSFSFVWPVTWFFHFSSLHI